MKTKAYAEMKQMIREEGKYYNPPVIKVGIYKGGKIEADGQKLEKKDCLFHSSLIFDDQEYWTHSTSDPHSALTRYERDVVREGDELAVWYCEAKKKYLVLAKVVRL